MWSGSPGNSSGYSALFRLLAAVVAVFFLAACTKTVARKPLEVRQFHVAWEDLDAQQLQLPGGLAAEGVVLTPAQLPLEASLKRLAQFDFIGVFTDFDLRFSSSSLDHETLRSLFAEGYVPALVRIRNTTEEPRFVGPVQLSLLADGETTLYSVPPEVLPARFKEVDWGKTAGTVLLSVLFIFVVLASAKEGRSPNSIFMRDAVDVGAQVAIQPSRGGRRSRSEPGEEGEGEADSTESTGAKKTPATHGGILWGGTLAPGATAEGFVFFQLDDTVADWRTVQLVPQ